MRLFFALWPPEGVADTLTGLARQQAERYGGKITRPESIHLTLAFLGEQPVDRLAEIVDVARRVGMVSFDLVIDRLGSWRHNRLLWAGSETVPHALSSLVDDLCGALRRAAIPFDNDPHGFVPHLTLLRKLPAAAFPLAPMSIQPIHWSCASFVLVESCLSSAGANYRVVAEFPSVS